MKEFAALHSKLEEARTTERAIVLLRNYFSTLAPEPAAWAIFFLCGRSLKTLIKSSKLRNWVQELASISDRLFEDSLEAVGDLAETIALILPACPESGSEIPLDQFAQTILSSLKAMPEPQQKQIVTEFWQKMNESERLIFNKILAGNYHSPVSLQVLISALAETHKLPAQVIQLRLDRQWQPVPEFYENLSKAEIDDVEECLYYNFLLASPLSQSSMEELGDFSNWFAEWKWDGLRAQLIKRGKTVSLWTRNDLLVTEYFPEIVEEARGLPDGLVIDGQILGWKDSDVLPFETLKQRLSKKDPTKPVREQVPAIFMAFDLLEEDGKKLCQQTIETRRERLAYVLSNAGKFNSCDEINQLQLFAPCRLQLSPVLRQSPIIDANSWSELKTFLDDARRMKMTGLILKKKNSQYTEGRNGLWYKIKAKPIKLNLVLVNATTVDRNQYTYSEYGFGIWNEGQLVAFTKVKADCDLNAQDKEIIDSFIRKNTIARFGPVRSVRPELVFELEFDAIVKSERHKSGFLARSPRLTRLCPELKLKDADSVDFNGKRLNS